MDYLDLNKERSWESLSAAGLHRRIIELTEQRNWYEEIDRFLVVEEDEQQQLQRQSKISRPSS